MTDPISCDGLRNTQTIKREGKYMFFLNRKKKTELPLEGVFEKAFEHTIIKREPTVVGSLSVCINLFNVFTHSADGTG